MRSQQQKDEELTPWGDEQNIITIQYRNDNKNSKKVTDQKNMKLSSNFNRFIQKRQLKLYEKFAQKLQQQKKSASTNRKKIQINNIKPPQKLLMNETFRLSQMFPSFSLNKMQKELTFYKRKHFSIQKPQTKQQAIKILPLRHSLGTNNYQQDSMQLGRNLTDARITYHLSMINKSFRDKALKSTNSKQSNQEREQLNSSANESNRAKLQRNKRKSKRYQEIIQFLQNKKEKNKIERCKTEQPIQLDKCLKSKKQFYCNLPKIQFIQISQ